MVLGMHPLDVKGFLALEKKIYQKSVLRKFTQIIVWCRDFFATQKNLPQKMNIGFRTKKQAHKNVPNFNLILGKVMVDR